MHARAGPRLPRPPADANGDLQFTPPARDIDPEALRAGAEACREFLDAAGGGPLDADDPEFQDAQLEFARCMREEGIDVPDPQPGQGLGQAAARIDLDDPAVQAAFDRCGSIIQGAFGGGGE